MKILDLGCGKRKRQGAIGIDINPKTNADVIHDLNKFPYPFEENYFDEIYADNVIEHLDSVIGVMEELHRITKPGGLIKVDVPYFRARWAYVDPTHSHFFTVDSFSYFEIDHLYNKLFPYSKVNLKLERLIFNEKIPANGLKNILKRLLVKLANRRPLFYEMKLSHLFPLDELSFYLRVVK